MFHFAHLRFIFFMVLVLLVGIGNSQINNAIPSAVNSISLRSDVVNNKIRLTWNNWYSGSGGSNFKVYRKNRESGTWTLLTTLSPSTFQWTDQSSAENVKYEYRVERVEGSQQINAYVSTGINIDEQDYRGRILLLVDSTFKTSLSAHIIQTELDMVRDGWSPSVRYIKNSDTRTTVRNKISSWYAENPQTSKGVFIIGHVPIYQTGNMNPDGHDPMPWATDSYYGDMSHSWTSNLTTIPSELELFIGRVDFSGINQGNNILFPGLTQSQLLANYLTKLHEYKNAEWIAEDRVLLKDNLVWAGAVGEIGFRTAGTLFSSAQITNLSPWPNENDNHQEVTNLMKLSQGWLMGLFWGRGHYEDGNKTHGVNGIGNVNTFSSNPCNIVFTTYCGSYVGNWEGSGYPMNYGNFLKVALYSGKTLTVSFSGLPNVTLHNMGMGEPIGFSHMESVNNHLTQLYRKQNGGWQGNSYTSIHLSLMGDPTLKLNYIPPPTNFHVIADGNEKCFSWDAMSGVDGYNVYSLNENNIPTRLNDALIVDPHFTAFSEGVKFSVRSVKLTIRNGTYQNLSLANISQPLMDVCENGGTPLNVRAAISGAVSGNSMRMDLNGAGYIPLNSPYDATQLNEIPFGMVDWVKLTIVDACSAPMISFSGLLMSDGQVLSPTLTPLRTNIGEGMYRLSLEHRNHIRIFSTELIDFSSPSITYDFTSDGIYGGGYVMTTMGAAMIPGDVNGDGKVKYTGSNNDRDAILLLLGDSNAKLYGYYDADVNLDGAVKYTGTMNDRDVIVVSIGGYYSNTEVLTQVPDCDGMLLKDDDIVQLLNNDGELCFKWRGGRIEIFDGEWREVKCDISHNEGEKYYYCPHGQERRGMSIYRLIREGNDPLIIKTIKF